jgi:hypothetical protein
LFIHESVFFQMFKRQIYLITQNRAIKNRKKGRYKNNLLPAEFERHAGSTHFVHRFHHLLHLGKLCQ